MKKKGEDKVVEPLREDPESQPNKGKKRRSQKGLPGVFDNAKKYPSIEEAMGELSAAMKDYAAAGKICQDRRHKIETLMLEHKVPTYALEDLVCSVEPGEPKLKVKRLKLVDEEAA